MSGETLLAALTTNEDIYRRSGQPTTLGDPVCREGFAVATTVVNGANLRILFGFDASAAGWQPLTLGTANYCDGYVAPEIAVHFPGCG